MPAAGTRNDLLAQYGISARTLQLLTRRELLEFTVKSENGVRRFMAADRDTDERLEVARCCESQLSENKRLIHTPFHRYMMYLVLTYGCAEAHRRLREADLIPPRRRYGKDRRSVYFSERVLVEHVNALFDGLPFKDAVVKGTPPAPGKSKARKAYVRAMEVMGLGDLHEHTDYLMRFEPLIEDPQFRLRVDRIAALDCSAADMAELLDREDVCELSDEDCMVYRHLFFDRDAFAAEKNRKRLLRRYPARWRRVIQGSLGRSAREYLITSTLGTEVAEEMEEIRLDLRRNLIYSKRLDGVAGLKDQLDLTGKYLKVATAIQSMSANTSEKIAANRAARRRIPLLAGDDLDTMAPIKLLQAADASTG